MSLPHRYRAAVKALRCKFLDEELVHAIVCACEAARAYRPERDPFKLQRDQINAARDKRAGLVNAARRLASACRTDDAGLATAIARAERQCAAEVVSLGARSDAPPPVTDTLGRLLSKLADEIEALDRADVNADPSAAAAACNHGNLRFERDIAGGLLPAPDTMLAIEVEFYIRAQTAGRRPDVMAWRDDSLKVGRPHRDLVALFVAAALPTKIDTAAAVQQRVRELPPGTRIMGWPLGMG